ncbi:hypothetical protein CLU79DRAFT_755959 [Phycomyces nitens]|nr:hypothetical protein CLU79DRAFT_755959 [Phycomyces nitens]
MFLKNLWLTISILLFTLLPNCRAPPVEQDDSESSSDTPVLSILQTIILGYIAHIVTVRPLTGVDNMGTNISRLLCFTYPTWGIGTAFDAIHDAYYADQIIGIEKFKAPLKKYEETVQNKDTENEDKDDKSLDPVESKSSVSLDEKNSEHSEFVDIKDQDSSSNDIVSKTEQLNTWLMKYMAENNMPIKEYDHAPYLAALLHIMGREKAKKTKHCIINNHILLGFDSKSYKNLPSREDTRTEKVSVIGPGAECEYQSNINPGNIRYLPKEMLIKLRTVHNIDNTSYMETLVTIVQLFFTTIECMNVDGDRWAKVIMIVYTAMSVIQTGSLLILHKQTEPFSLHYNSDVPWKEIMTERAVKVSQSKIDLLAEDEERANEIFEKTDKELFYNNSFLHFVMSDCRLEPEPDEATFKSTESTTIFLCLFGGMIASLLVGIWADFKSYSVTEWIVLAWILSPILALLGGIIDSLSPNENSELFSFFGIFISILFNFGCVIAATIYGYILEKK